MIELKRRGISNSWNGWIRKNSFLEVFFHYGRRVWTAELLRYTEHPSEGFHHIIHPYRREFSDCKDSEDWEKVRERLCKIFSMVVWFEV